MYYSLDLNKVTQVQPNSADGFTYTDETVVSGQLLEDGVFNSYVYTCLNDDEDAYIEDTNTVTTASHTALVATYTGYYKAVWEAKLLELDYDDNASVALYASISTSAYYDECAGLIDWREAMVKVNYAFQAAAESGESYDDTWESYIPTREEYLASLPDFSDYYSETE